MAERRPMHCRGTPVCPSTHPWALQGSRDCTGVARNSTDCTASDAVTGSSSGIVAGASACIGALAGGIGGVSVGNTSASISTALHRHGDKERQVSRAYMALKRIGRRTASALYVSPYMGQSAAAPMNLSLRLAAVPEVMLK